MAAEDGAPGDAPQPVDERNHLLLLARVASVGAHAPTGALDRAHERLEMVVMLRAVPERSAARSTADHSGFLARPLGQLMPRSNTTWLGVAAAIRVLPVGR